MKTYSRKNSSYLKKAFVASNFNEMCRLCLSEMDLGLTPIIQSTGKISYQEWIQYSVDVTVQEGDGLPPNICAECLKMVEQTYLFKKKCKSSDSKLREHMELIELSDENRHRQSEVRFSDLEDEQNLFRRNESTQSSGQESDNSEPGGGDGNTQTTETTGDLDVLEKSDDSAGNSTSYMEECTLKDVTDRPKVREQSDLKQTVNSKRTKDSEQQTVNIPQQRGKRKKGEVKRKESQGSTSKVKRFILKGERRTTDEDDEEEDLSVFEIVPVEKSEDNLVIVEDADESDEDGSDRSCPTTPGSNPVSAVKEICEQWKCDDPQQVGDSASTNYDLPSHESYASDDIRDTDDMNVTSDIAIDPAAQVLEQHQKVQQLQLHPTIGELQLQARSRLFPTCPVDQLVLPRPNEPDPYQVNRIYRTRSKIQIIETVPSETRYSCCTCPRTFPTHPELKEHLTRVHQISEASSCEICFKTFTCINSLRRHMMVHTGFKPYKCRICKRGFSQTSTLKRHVLTHQASKPFVCHQCNKSYTQKMSLVTHLKTHGTTTSGYIFTCQSCNKSFAHQSGLSRHLKEHKGFRFMCVDCMRSFVDPSALARHVKRIHQKESPRTEMNLRSMDRR